MRENIEMQAGEIQFGFDELFFSRTDSHGIIRFGNEVFQRLSGYAWEELDAKPHKIIRHPDMPRAVFWVLWETIKAGKPIGAYVKNRAKDGRHYWVFATVTPVAGGYLSVRLRPSTALLDVVKHEYAALRESELRENLPPAEAARALLQRLAELGFEDYTAFMSRALGQELAACDAALHRPHDQALQRFADLADIAQDLLKQAEVISTAYLSNEHVPFNFRVLAAQLGQDGAAIGVISSNYGQLSNDMRAILDPFTSAALDVRRTIKEGYFLAATARIQREAVAAFAREKSGEACAESALLALQSHDYAARAAKGLSEIAKNAAEFKRACIDMRRLAGGLEMTRVMGKVECARHQGVKDRTDELLGDLDHFQKTIARALADIDAMNQRIAKDTGVLLNDVNRAA